MKIMSNIAITVICTIAYFYDAICRRPARTCSVICCAGMMFLGIYAVKIETDRAKILYLLQDWAEMTEIERVTTRGNQISAELRELKLALETEYYGERVTTRGNRELKLAPETEYYGERVTTRGNQLKLAPETEYYGGE